MGKKAVYKVKAEDASFCVVALNTTEEDYRLAWLLNCHLKINLARTECLNHSFPVFSYLDEIAGINYTLVSNKIKGSYLAPQLKHVDYIFKISGNLTQEAESDILSKIRALHEVAACIPIKTEVSTLVSFLSNL